MIRSFDARLGGRVFVPIVIWICQRADTTQHRFHNYGWMLVSWLWLYAAGARGAEAMTVPIAFAVFMTGLAATMPDREGYTALWFRMLFVGLEAMHLTEHATGLDLPLVGPNLDASCPTGLMILACEYATTIRTIPPRGSRQRQTARSEAST
jgi:hypothetical protein